MKSDGAEPASERKQNQFLRVRRRVVPQTTLQQLMIGLYQGDYSSIQLNANLEALETKGTPSQMSPILQSKEMPRLSRSTLL